MTALNKRAVLASPGQLWHLGLSTGRCKLR